MFRFNLSKQFVGALVDTAPQVIVLVYCCRKRRESRLGRCSRQGQTIKKVKLRVTIWEQKKNVTRKIQTNIKPGRIESEQREGVGGREARAVGLHHANPASLKDKWNDANTQYKKSREEWVQ